jgi:hypothetical protein
MNDDFLRSSVIPSYLALSMSPLKVTLNIRNNAKESTAKRVKEEITETKDVLEMSLNLNYKGSSDY